jgi:hypothetical protein
MTERTSAHFDEDTAARWQVGDATEAERTHLAGCAECQAQARPLGDALSCFGAAAREWGEERASVTREWSAAKAAAAQEWRESKAAAEHEQKQELARDNTLLDEVDQDVSQVVPEAMQPLSWNAANNNAAGTTDGTASRQ